MKIYCEKLWQNVTLMMSISHNFAFVFFTCFIFITFRLIFYAMQCNKKNFLRQVLQDYQNLHNPRGLKQPTTYMQIQLAKNWIISTKKETESDAIKHENYDDTTLLLNISYKNVNPVRMFLRLPKINRVTCLFVFLQKDLFGIM